MSLYLGSTSDIDGDCFPIYYFGKGPTPNSAVSEVLIPNPFSGTIGMPSLRPLPEHFENLVIDVVECPRGDHMMKIVYPSSNFRIQEMDEIFRFCGWMRFYNTSEVF